MSFSQRSESVQTAALVVVLEKLDKAYFANREQKKEAVNYWPRYQLYSMLRVTHVEDCLHLRLHTHLNLV